LSINDVEKGVELEVMSQMPSKAQPDFSQVSESL
jgi:hypothetical protein